MNILDGMTVISFFLSSYLAVNKIINHIVKLDVRIIEAYTAGDIIYLKIILNNKSNVPLALTSIEASNKKENISCQSTTYNHLILGDSEKKLYSKGLPINIPPKTALSHFIALPTGKNLANFLKSDLTVYFEINNKYYPQDVNINSILLKPERLLKEIS